MKSRFWILLLCLVCLSRETSADEPASPLRIFPEIVKLRGRDARHQLLVSTTEDGRSLDVTREAKFQIADSELIRVDENGVVTPSKSGHTKITVSYAGQTASIPVEVEQGESFLPVDFQTEIVPILTRRGCNGGGCHGKTTGQGGFRLSLFGYNPSADYTWVTRDSTARRICVPNPQNSLLLLKPTLTIGHAGGGRLKHDEPEYQRLVRWIERGAPEQAAETIPTLERLQLSPAEVSLRPEGQHQLVAIAHYSDGTKRDVTRLAVFKANQNQIADADEWGLVTAGNRLGEGVITATFSGQVAVSRIRIPLDRKWTEPDFPIQNVIDRHVLAQLRSLRIPPSEVCDEDAFLRRATLQIAGRLPTHEEVKTFQADPNPDKRQQLVQRLLDDPGYADHFAQKWSGILRNKRRGQSARVPGTIAFHRWIRRAIALNKPYDQFVREIITATGDVSVNPPAQWYAEVRYLDRYVDDTAQVFLGMRIGCARCHHHPFEKISQEDYFGLAAFFSRVDRKGGTGVAERRANEVIFVKSSGSVKHPLTGEVVLPHGLGQPEQTIPPFADPRNHLVDWMTQPDNPYFARAFVNRMWAHFFGRGLVDPLDDLRVTNPASNEPLLEALSREFIDSGFDMKRIVELICSSTTYQLSSHPNEHNLTDTQNFSRFYPQRLTAEVLLDAIDQATGVPTSYSGLPPGTRALQLPDEDYSNEFLNLFGRPPRDSACECERSAEPSLSQSLFAMNDQFSLGKVTSGNSLAAKLAKEQSDPSARIREMFLATLSRAPNSRETQDAMDYLKEEADPKKAFGNLLWVLINTKEFQYVH